MSLVKMSPNQLYIADGLKLKKRKEKNSNSENKEQREANSPQRAQSISLSNNMNFVCDFKDYIIKEVGIIS